MDDGERLVLLEDRLRELTREYDKHIGAVENFWKVQHRWNPLIEVRLDETKEGLRALQQDSQQIRQLDPSSASPRRQKALIAGLCALLLAVLEAIKALIVALGSG